MNWDGLIGQGFILTVRPGMTAEYRRRHAEIWPEMAEALRRSGVVFYEIFLDAENHRVFGHVVRDRPPPPEDDPVIERWRAYMADVLEMDGAMPRRTPVDKVFRLTG